MSARIIDRYEIKGEGVVLLIERVTLPLYEMDQTEIDWDIVHENPNGDQDVVRRFDMYNHSFSVVQAEFGQYIDEVLDRDES